MSVVAEVRSKKGNWLNTKNIINPVTDHPCWKLDWCPYGMLVEEFKLRDPPNETFSCKVFGHDCPAHYHRENFAEKKVKE